MDEFSAHEGAFQKKRLSVTDYERIVAVMSHDGRRAFVDVDGHRLDVVGELTAARASAAREVNVSSYWADPEKPHFGRRYFVYLVADRAGVRYFGDSDSPQVVQVCRELDHYLTHAVADPAASPTAAVNWWDGPARRLHPSTWAEPYNRVPPWAVPAALALLVLLFGFLLGRASVGRDADNPPSTPMNAADPVPQPATMPVN